MDPAHEITIDIPGVAETIGNMPEPQPHAIEEMRREDGQTNAFSLDESSSAGSTGTDAAGVAFDRAIHATGSDGNGVRTAKGTWRKKRGLGAASRVGSGKPTTDVAAATQSAAELRNKAGAAGVVAAQSIFLICRAIGGEEWKPTQEPIDENAIMQDAWRDYFIATNRTEFPPWLGLTIALGAYAAPRFTMPKTRERAQSLKVKAYLWWQKRKEARAKKKAGPASETAITEQALS